MDKGFVPVDTGGRWDAFKDDNAAKIMNACLAGIVDVFVSRFNLQLTTGKPNLMGSGYLYGDFMGVFPIVGRQLDGLMVLTMATDTFQLLLGRLPNRERSADSGETHQVSHIFDYISLEAARHLLENDGVARLGIAMALFGNPRLSMAVMPPENPSVLFSFNLQNGKTFTAAFALKKFNGLPADSAASASNPGLPI